MNDWNRTIPYRKAAEDEEPGEQPQHIGRYRVERTLGQGGFGIVYLAHDEQLQRLVAIKVPHRRLVSRPEDAEPYLDEARTVANLDHPNIVPVHDVGCTADFPCFVVSKFIEGTTLASQLRTERLMLAAAAELVATVAETLHYAHGKGLVHRDVKPGNILLDTSGKPYVADFGLALREENIGQGPRFVGTPSFMSPEQARGEGHRVDGRSDLFSLGIVLYVLLTYRPPFHASSREQVLEQIITLDPRPPRQWDDTIPRELERICLKALAKRATERYATGKDMAEDLRHFLTHLEEQAQASPRPDAPADGNTPTAGKATPVGSEQGPVAIVPKGLRSFDAHDADFFLKLLPGPRDRDGLPDSIRFWKARVEELSPDRTFAVGLLYGPSGCGKSSLVKAGLLPRLSANVLSVHVEATPEGTEARMLKSLRRLFPRLPAAGGLKETLAILRQGRDVPVGKKLLLIIDQFEQWLHARPAGSDGELVQALRQCDGSRVQCVVMVRDDFWMATTRFLRDLEVRLIEGVNSAAVDLFDLRHARKVLAAFGRAFGALGDAPTPDNDAFLEQAVAGLAEDGKVISVRLALFAEMVKSKPWTPATLRAIGGVGGVGVVFLEETFSAKTAPPEHRLHQRAARAVLTALLPEQGSDLKGHMRSQAELLTASGYGARSQEFEDLLRILDGELRLITPTDPEGSAAPSVFIASRSQGASERETINTERYYQLTHDYLVPALRDWLTHKQKETPAGRAQLLLADRAALWSGKPEPKQLPSLAEWGLIVARTNRAHWSEAQRRMMRVASRRHLAGIGAGVAALAALVLLAVGLSVLWHQYQRLEWASHLTDQLLAAELPRVPNIAEQLHALPGPWRTRLHTLAADDSSPASERLRAHLALVSDEPASSRFLLARLVEAPLAEFDVILQALQPHQIACCAELWSLVREPSTGVGQRFRAAAALAQMDSDNADWVHLAGPTAATLVRDGLLTAPGWARKLRPARQHLLKALTAEFADSDAPDSQRILAASILADYAAEDPTLLADLIQRADPGQFQALLPAVQAQAGPCAEIMRKVLAVPSRSLAGDLRQRTRRRANSAIALLLLGQPEPVCNGLGQSDDPDLRTALIDLLPLLVDIDSLWALQRQTANALSRQAIVLAVEAHHSGGRLSAQAQDRLRSQLAEMLVQDDSAAVHSAAEWLLRKLGVKGPLERLSGQARAGWRVSVTGHTLVLIRGPVEFHIGSPADEPRRDNGEDRTLRRIAYSYEIGAHEVTVRQFRKFFPDHRFAADVSPTPDCPANYVSWYDAARYCRLLSEAEGIPELEMVFPPVDEIRPERELILPENWLHRTGYRWPTEAEWEYACRAGTTTARFFGDLDDPLPRYGWWRSNANERCWPVGALRPNPFGLFDVLGNVGEWCFDRKLLYSEAPAPEDGGARTIRTGPLRVVRGGTYQQMSKDLRSAKRDGREPNGAFSYNGFRIARTVPTPSR